MIEKPKGLLPCSNRRRVGRTVVLVLLGLLSVDCAAKTKRVYPGPELPPQETALIVGSTHRLFTLFYNRTFFVHIESVDDYPGDPDTTEWALQAGPHTVKTGYYRKHLAMLGGAFASWSRQPRFQTITFTAAAGHRYRADGHIIETTTNASEYCAWIEDEESHAVVGGARDCGPADTDAVVPTATAP